MDELLQVFVEHHLHDEIQTDVRQAFDLFDFFEYRQAYGALIDILTDEVNQSIDMIRDAFLAEVNSLLDYVLEQHTLFLKPTATLDERVQICKALAHVQKLRDYTPILRVLESFESDEVQLAQILAEMTMMSEGHILELIDSFSPSMLTKLRDYVYTKDKDVYTPESVNSSVIRHLKDFGTLFNDKALGLLMLENGVLPGAKFETYVNLVDLPDIVVDDLDVTAQNILSVIYLSCDGYNSPLLVYRKYSYQLLADLNKTSAVEVKILGMIAKLTEYEKARDEKARLSESGTAS